MWLLITSLNCLWCGMYYNNCSLYHSSGASRMPFSMIYINNILAEPIKWFVIKLFFVFHMTVEKTYKWPPKNGRARIVHGSIQLYSTNISRRLYSMWPNYSGKVETKGIISEWLVQINCPKIYEVPRMYLSSALLQLLGWPKLCIIVDTHTFCK